MEEFNYSQYLFLANEPFNDLYNEKICTIRQGYRDINLDHLLFVNSDTCKKQDVLVHTVIHTYIKYIPIEYVKAEGFNKNWELCDSLMKYYPDISMDDECTIIVFYKVLKQK